MTIDRYNGWTNRETWNANLWITNDEGTYDQAREIVTNALAEPSNYPDWTPAEQRSLALSHAGDALREWWEEAMDPEAFGGPVFPGPVLDAWMYALACVDWREIAEGLAEE